MDRINRIICHPLWQKHVNAIHDLEKDRIFCRHNTSHFLDVARLAYIEALEKKLNIQKDLIYAAALLHDIGRDLQYTKGIPHDEAGADLAEKILPECGFSSEETAQIAKAILGHRNSETRSDNGLSGLLYRADKASRPCLLCDARPQCNWSTEKMNLTLKG